MGTAADADKFDRERRVADARYNDALTAFDRAVADCHGRELTRDDFDRLAHTLIMFLQQITAFVDVNDRAVGRDVDRRMERIEHVFADIDELRTRVALLQRGSRPSTVSNPAVVAQQHVAGAQIVGPPSDLVYVGFEDRFRGPDASVAEKLRGYLPLFAGSHDVVDLGCGRGEFLAALKEAGITARGVDSNAEMVAVARERGLQVAHDDALRFIEAVAPESIGGAIATQVVEHLEASYLVRLLQALARALEPGAPIVLETINPACWLAFFSSYIRDITHVRPLHPDTLQYLLRAHGFERVEIRYSAPVPDQMKLRSIDLPAPIWSSTDPTAAAVAQVAHAVNANVALLNSLMFSYMDYAVVGYCA